MIKKGIAVIFLFACIFSLFAGQSLAQGSEITYGDINGDNKIDSSDFSFLKRYVIGKVNFTTEEMSRADVNADGKVNSMDMAFLKRKILGMISVLPAEQQNSMNTEEGVIIKSYDIDNKTITFESSVNGSFLFKYGDDVDPKNKEHHMVDIVYRDGVIYGIKDRTTVKLDYISKVNETDDQTKTFFNLDSVTLKNDGGIYYGLSETTVKVNDEDIAIKGVWPLCNLYAKVYVVDIGVYKCVYRIEAFELQRDGIISSTNTRNIGYQTYSGNFLYLNGLEYADLLYVFIDGEQKTLSDLKDDMYFIYWKSDDGKKIVISASSAKASGKLTEVDSHTIDIGGIKYTTFYTNDRSGYLSRDWVSIDGGKSYNYSNTNYISNHDVVAYIGIDKKIYYLKGTSPRGEFIGLVKSVDPKNQTVTVIRNVEGVSKEIEYSIDDVNYGYLKNNSTYSTIVTSGAINASSAVNCDISWNLFVADGADVTPEGSTERTSVTNPQHRIYKFFVDENNKLVRITRNNFAVQNELKDDSNFSKQLIRINQAADSLDYIDNSSASKKSVYLDNTMFFDLAKNKIVYWSDIAGYKTTGTDLMYSLDSNNIYVSIVAFVNGTYISGEKEEIEKPDESKLIYYAYINSVTFLDPYYSLCTSDGTILKIHKDKFKFSISQIENSVIEYVKSGEDYNIISVTSSSYDYTNGLNVGNQNYDSNYSSAKIINGNFTRKDGAVIRVSSDPYYYPLSSDTKVIFVKPKPDGSQIEFQVPDYTIYDINQGEKVVLVVIEGKIRAIYFLRGQN